MFSLHHLEPCTHFVLSTSSHLRRVLPLLATLLLHPALPPPLPQESCQLVCFEPDEVERNFKLTLFLLALVPTYYPSAGTRSLLGSHNLMWERLSITESDLYSANPRNSPRSKPTVTSHTSTAISPFLKLTSLFPNLGK